MSACDGEDDNDDDEDGDNVDLQIESCHCLQLAKSLFLKPAKHLLIIMVMMIVCRQIAVDTGDDDDMMTMSPPWLPS